MLPFAASLLLHACAPATLRLMVFNIEYGGDVVEFGQSVEAIEAASADRVAIEEAWGNVPRLAREARFPEYDVRQHVLSRLPLLDPPEGHGRFLFVEPSPGCVVALANVHLPSDPSIEEALERDGFAGAAEVERESRLRALEPTLEELDPLLASGVPVLLAGDFNTLSHLDDGRPWPTSRAVEAAGLRDTWRILYPDTRSHPGFTWWAARPRVAGWNPDPDAPRSRIDRLYSGGPAKIKDLRIVGEAGGDGVDLSVSPWPSDHRALLATLEVSSVPAPTLVSAWPPRVARGEEIRARVRGFEEGWKVALGTRTHEARLEDVLFSTASLAPGLHEVALIDSAGRKRSGATVFLVEEGEAPSVSITRRTVKSGEPIEVRWSGAPGNRWDWIGVYAENADLDRDPPLLWRHTQARLFGETTLDASAEGGGWPLSAGRYRLYLCEDDGYRALASAPFTVEP